MGELGSIMELRAEQGERVGQTYRPDRPVVTVGRAQDSDLQLQEQGISRRHARLQSGAQGWTITDLGSTNGTFVNGRRLPPQERYILRTGDRITIGSSVFAFREVRQESDAERPASASLGHPAVRVLGAVLFVAVVAGIVALLVFLLQPEEEAVTPTPGNPVDLMVTALPVPTEFEGIVTAVVPLLPSGLPLFPAEPSATPEPSGDSMEGALAQGQIENRGHR
jgi:pSer/pThr/pTyr-binding forkhead associated (FHA) protein